MSVGDIVVYVIAFVAIGIVLFGTFLFILNRWRDILKTLGMLTVAGAVIAAGLLALGIAIVGGVYAWQYVSDQKTMQDCLTAYERRAKALAAPDDYFGEQLREAAANEAKKCEEFAAKKKAESASKK